MRRWLVWFVAILAVVAAPFSASGGQPILGPDRAIHLPRVTPTLDAESGVVAASEVGYLVVWVNQSTTTYDRRGMLRAARVSEDGEVIDVPGIPVAPTLCRAAYPDVVGGGRTWLVGFECDEGAVIRYHAVLVGGDGAVRPLDVDMGGSPQAITWTGSRYLLQSDVTTVRSFDEDGAESAEPLKIADTTFVLRRFCRAGGRTIALLEGLPVDGGDTLRGSYIVTIDGDEVSEPVGLAGFPEEKRWFASFDGERILLGFLENGVFDRAMLFALDGTLVRGPFDLPFSEEFSVADVVWQGDRHIVRYYPFGNDNPLILRLDRNGDVVDDAPIESVEGEWAVGARGILAVHFQVARPPSTAAGLRYGVFATLLDRGGAPLWLDPDRDIPIATSRQSQGAARLASDGEGGTIAVWVERTSLEDACVFLSPVPTAPNASVRVGCGASSDAVAIATGPESSLVMWSGWNGVTEKILAARVTRSGVVLDSEPILLSPNATIFDDSIAAAWDGTQFVVVWTEGHPLYTREHVRLVVSRVTKEGVVLDRDPVRLGTSERSTVRPSIARRGGELVLAWEEGDELAYHAQYLLVNRSIVVRRLSTRFGLTAGLPVRVAQASENEPEPGIPEVACHELGCSVAFGTAAGDVRVAFVPLESLATGAGTGEPIVLAAGAWSPSLAWDGRAFVAAWVRGDGFDRDVLVRRLDATGRPDGEVTVVSATEELEVSPSVASPGDGTVVLSYSRTAPEQRLGGTILNFVRRETIPRSQPVRR